MTDIQTLKGSLIYQMSLGSKELYHSNVWAWLIEVSPEFLRAFGLGDYISAYKRVGREEGHRDLTIYLDSSEWKKARFIIIENKLKSIPGIEQLKKYQDSVPKEAFVQGILTGIQEPQIVQNEVDGFVPGWRFVDYSTIGAEIERIARELNDDQHPIIKDNFGAISEYCKNIRILNEVVNVNVVEDTLTPFSPSDYGTYDDLGLIDLVNKVRASRFMRHFDKQSKDDRPNFPKGAFIHGHGFNNKKNTLDFRYVAEDGFLIGIQIEGDQFRRVVQINPKGPNALTEKELFTKFCGKWFDGDFDGEKKDKSRCLNWEGALSPLPTKMTGTHCKYETKEYCFVYQYVTLGKEDMKFSNLYRLLIDNLRLAEELFHGNRQGDAK